MKKYIRALLILSFCMMISCIRFNAANAESFQHEVSEASSSSNINRHDYDWNNASSPTSCLYHEKNGDFTRVEYLGDVLFVVERYDKDLNLISKNLFNIDENYRIFGGIYVNDNYIFIASGRIVNKAGTSDPDITITQFDKKGNRIKGLFLAKTNTIEPFSNGSCSFLEKDGSLYIRTCHSMMPGYDGLSHQASMMIKMNVETCNLESKQVSIANSMSGYVSHSFNQFLAKKNGLVYACDHGDANYRGIEVLRYNKANVDYNVTAAVPFTFDGSKGDNETGAMLGGFAISSTHTLSAGTSKKQFSPEENASGSNTVGAEDGKVKNIFVATTSLDDIDSQNVKWITNYDKDGKYTASNPYIVDLEDDTYMLIWQVCEVVDKHKGNPTGELNFVRIDDRGNTIDKIQEIQGALSDCQPILAGDNIVWYVTDRSYPTFYRLPKNGKLTFDDNTASDQEVTRHIDNICYDGVFRCYEKSDGKKCAELKKVVLQYEERMDELVIPSYISVQGSKYAVTKIAKGAVKDFTWLSNIEFPDTIEQFEDDCISNCTNIMTVTNYSKTPYIPNVNYIVSDAGGNTKGKLSYWYKKVYESAGWKQEKVTEIKDGTTAYAYVDHDELSIQFVDESKNGKIEVIGVVKFYKGDIITPPTPPKKDGYKFAGWDYFGELIDFTKPIERDLHSVTVKWEKVSDKDNKDNKDSKPGKYNTTKKPAPKLYTQKISTIGNAKFNHSIFKDVSLSFNLNAKAKGKLTYKVTKGSSKYIVVSKKGKVTLKIGCKKGIYKITITAAKTKKYKAAKKIFVIKVV